ncbi:MAG TPA: CdaR family protein [Candidatus Limnocylindria bacterium]|nr:CdaR family protein [Candidatus Limnocylindria bacterium]
MRLIFRNWHLKLGAMALAVILYTGFVYSGSFSEETLPGVPVAAINQPPRSYLLTQQLATVDVRYRLAADAPQRVTPESFAVTIDLAGYDMSAPATQQSLPVVVRPLGDGVTVLTYAPASLSVSLDAVSQRSVPVGVDRGVVPDGLEASQAQLSQRQVTATGPASRLGQVDRALARVRIDESGIDVTAQVELVPVDVDGRPVASVELNPSFVTVRIDVRTVLTSKTVPVRPLLVGAPAPGFEVGPVRVLPPVVSLTGAPADIASVVEVTTAALSLAGADADVDEVLEISLPPGTVISPGGQSGVNVSVTIRPIAATRTFITGISCVGVAPGGGCVPGVTQVAVTVAGNLADLEALSVLDVAPTVDVAGLVPGIYQLAPSVSLPDGFSLVSITPELVSVVVSGPAP